MARMAPLTMGRSEVLPVRLSMIVTELVAMVGTPSCRLISSGGRCSPLTPGKSVTGPDLLRGHRAALADSVPDEKPAVAIHAGDAAHESPASVMDLDLASRQDIAPAPRLEDGSRTVLPVAPHPLVEGIEVVGGKDIAVDLVTRGCPQRGRLRFGPQG